MNAALRLGIPPPQGLERFRAAIAARLGLQFDHRQDDWLAEVLARRGSGAELALYLDALEHAPSATELDALASELTVGETFFFRHLEQFEALSRQVLPQWLRRRRPGQRLRVLSAGCASGEEAYTLAICLQRSGLVLQGVDWEVVGFDLNPEAVARAEAGRYGDWSLRAAPEALRGPWLQREGAQYVLHPALRERVRFERRNVCAPDAAFWQAGAFDVVFCRNMLMYLDMPSLQQALAHLTQVLPPGGFLFLGHAETLREQAADFQLLNTHGCFYYQRRGAEPLPGDAPPDARPGPSPASAPPPPPDPARATALLVLALQQLDAGRLDDCREPCVQLRTGPAPDALVADSYYVEALADEQAGRLPAAEWHYRRAAAKDGSFALPRLRLGLLARRRGERVTMQRELDQALALLDGEDDRRLRLFGGGFDRAALRHLCQAELREAGS